MSMRTRLKNAMTTDNQHRIYVRQVMNADIKEWLNGLDPATKDAVEVSGAVRADVPWKSYRQTWYPELDLTAPYDGPQYDVVICEQVLEHVNDPFAAARTLYALTRPGGWALVSTPFLIRVHEFPNDHWRFLPHTLGNVLQGAGFAAPEVKSWGNRTAVISNLYGWTPYWRFLPLSNHPDFPVVVWAYAQRPAEGTVT